MNIKNLALLSFCFLFQIQAYSQPRSESLQIIDISSKQIKLMNRYQNEPINIRDSILTDSIYKPHKYLWNGYLGEEKDFIEWVNTVAYKELPEYNLKAKKINLTHLNDYFFETVKEMEAFTGYRPQGLWYIFFGPKWTNLGGFEDGTMLIDLAHKSNKSLSDIQLVFPHEINHQIYSNTLQEQGNDVLSRILDEGFACYVSYMFHNGTTTKAEELYYSETDLEMCIDNEIEAMELLREHNDSNDNQLSRNFASRGYKFSNKLPSAIGYYIGFRIVEEYVKMNGQESWKDIYSLKSEEVLQKSKILD